MDHKSPGRSCFRGICDSRLLFLFRHQALFIKHLQLFIVKTFSCFRHLLSDFIRQLFKIFRRFQAAEASPFLPRSASALFFPLLALRCRTFLPEAYLYPFNPLLLKQSEPEAQNIATALEIYVNGSLNVFNHRSNIDMNNHRVLCFQLKSLGKALKEIGLLIMQDAVWNRVTANRSKHKTTWFYIDEFHLLLKGQTGSFSVEIWKRFRKWGGIPSGLTQNVKDLLASREIENIFENSDFIYMLNQAQGDRQILAKQLGISPHQLSYVTHSGPGEGLLFFGNVIIPFVDHFPKDTLLYSVLTTRPDEVAGA